MGQGRRRGVSLSELWGVFTLAVAKFVMPRTHSLFSLLTISTIIFLFLWTFFVSIQKEKHNSG